MKKTKTVSKKTTTKARTVRKVASVKPAKTKKPMVKKTMALVNDKGQTVQPATTTEALSVLPPKGTRPPLMVYTKGPNGEIGPFAQVVLPVTGNLAQKHRLTPTDKNAPVVQEVRVRSERVCVRVWAGDERNGHGALAALNPAVDLILGARLRWFGGTASTPARAELILVNG